MEDSREDGEDMEGTQRIQVRYLNVSLSTIVMDPALYEKAIADYHARCAARKRWYENNKEKLLTEKRKRYAVAHPDVKKKRKDSSEEVAQPSA